MPSGGTRLRPSPKNAIRELLKQVGWLVSAGSVDGVCTTAAVLRNAAGECGVEFCQAFTVDRVDPSQWPTHRRVLLIGLAVNNRDEAMTVDFLRRVTRAGHRIIGVLDQHRADDWVVAFCRAELRAGRLLVKPVTGLKVGIRSSGKHLLRLMGDDADGHTRELCQAAIAADRMDFDTHCGTIVNAAIKPKLDDNLRRVYLARHLATNGDPDDIIQGWMAEYDEIQRHHDEIIAARVELGDGLVRVVSFGRQVDMTRLRASLYCLGYLVAVTDGESFHQQARRRIRQISFGCAPRVHLNLVAALKDACIAVSGYRRNATVALADELPAIEVVRRLLVSQC